MDSDEVNSINDTVESQQVVTIIKTVYDDIISRGDLDTNKVLFNLDASGDSTKPVLMTKPENIDRINWIKYNKIQDGETDPSWGEVQYVPLERFIEMSYMLLPSESTVDTFTYTSDHGSFTFVYRNDTGPSYYTSIDDNVLIFDAFDEDVDSTLQSSKTLCYGTQKTDFTESDSFVPNLQPQQFALLLNEAKSLAWTELKQIANPKAEKTARRNWVHLGKTRQSVPSGSFGTAAHPFSKLPNYGRK